MIQEKKMRNATWVILLTKIRWNGRGRRGYKWGTLPEKISRWRRRQGIVKETKPKSRHRRKVVYRGGGGKKIGEEGEERSTSRKKKHTWKGKAMDVEEGVLVLA